MPAQSRKDNPQLRALDKETKRARGALSCAECRRLKLKCDKTVPCASCKRRGCSAICPNGSLITGQGTRFVLADTEKLHQKIGQMSDRIRQLEDAVAILQSTLSSEPHPLLARDLLKIKSSIELHAAVGDEVASQSKKQEEPEEEGVIDAFGTLAIREDGAATFYGRSAGSESLLIGEASPTTDEPDPIGNGNTTNQPSPVPPNTLTQHHIASSPSTAAFVFSTLHAAHAPASSSNPHHLQVQPTPRESIASLSSSFPLSTNAFQTITIDMDYLLHHFLPKWEEAWRLAQLYLEQAPWFFGAVTKRQLLEEMLPMWYYEARGLVPGNTPSPPGSGVPPLTPISPIDTSSAANAASPGSYSTSSSSSSATTTNHPHIHSRSPLTGTKRNHNYTTRSAHDLALLFMIFCFGALTDTGLPAAPENVMSEEFFQLTKAVLVLEPVLERPPSVATVQTLSLMAIYEGICSKDGSVERTWSLFGVAVKLAQSIGLHRDCARWKLPPAEVQKRRALFWELFITDCWQSLATGRLATFSLPFVDCELPSDPDSTIADDGSVQPSFPYWKARFGAECVSAVVQGTLTSRAPKYSIILDLDRKVRDMEMPMYTQQTHIVDYLNGHAVLAHAQAQAQAQAQTQDVTGETLGMGLGETMSRFMPVNYRELTLLYIHRCFFAHAISTHPNDPIKSTYAPSFLAGYRSACTILGSVRQQFTLFPKQIARFWVLWTHAFSATVMLASVATHVSKQTQVAHAALIELNSACELFQQAASHGGRAVKFLPILQRLRSKAQKAFQDSAAGVPSSVPNDIFKPSKTDEEKNELEIFGGKTHTVATLRSTGGGSSGGTGRPDSAGSLSSSRASSGSPQVKPLIHHQQQQQQNQLGVQVQFQGPGSGQVASPQTYGPPAPPPPPPNVYPQQQQSSQAPQVSVPVVQQQQLMDEYPAFEGVHPSLVHELHGFDGRIEAQVREAYSMGAGVGYGMSGVIREGDERQVQGNGVGGSTGMVGIEFEPDQVQVQAQAQAQAQEQERLRREMEYQQQVQMQMEEERGLREREDRERERQRRLEIERQREQEREREREMAEKREYEYEMQRARQQQQHQVPPSTYQPQPSQQPYNEYYDESSRMAAPSRRQRPSQSNLRQAYGPEAMYQSGPSQYHPPPPAQQPQQLQVIPPQQYISARDTLVTPSSSTMSEQGSPYDVQSPYSQQPYPQQQQYAPGQGQGQYVQETYPQRQYWSEGYAAQPLPPQTQPQAPPQPPQHVQYSTPPPPQQQQYSTQVPPGHPGHPHYQQQQQQQHYTPAGVLRGIAADDSRLQETWATYMYNVASPRPFFED